MYETRYYFKTIPSMVELIEFERIATFVHFYPNWNIDEILSRRGFLKK
jgi:hypothetical protein